MTLSNEMVSATNCRPFDITLSTVSSPALETNASSSLFRMPEYPARRSSGTGIPLGIVLAGEGQMPRREGLWFFMAEPGWEELKL
jgi:hypothetical protein